MCSGMGADPGARRRFLEQIRSHIASHGCHVTLVQQGEIPRFAYTVGLTEAGAPELLLAGAIALSADQAIRTLNHGGEVARRGALGDTLDVPDVGSFAVGPADRSWSDHMVLGALDYYGRETLPALQLVPAGEMRTFDVPDTSRPWDAAREPVWRRLVPTGEPELPGTWTAVVDLDALRGKPVSEAARWEEDDWELFSGPGPDFGEDEVRVIALGLLLAHDPTLEPVTRLGIGEALWRDPPGPWQPWGNG
jgi:hypothetical protein